MAFTGLTCKEIEERIQALLLRPLHAETAKAAILNTFVVNATIRQMARVWDWTALGETITDLTITAGTREVAKPPRVKNQVRAYWLNGEARQRIWGEREDVRVTMEWIREHYPDPTDTDSEPLYFAIHGTNLVVVPTLSADVSLDVDCNRFPADLGADERNWFTENAADAMIFLGTALGCEILGESAKGGDWEQIGLKHLKSAIDSDVGEQTSRTGPLSAHVGHWERGRGWR